MRNTPQNNNVIDTYTPFDSHPEFGRTPAETRTTAPAVLEPQEDLGLAFQKKPFTSSTPYAASSLDTVAQQRQEELERKAAEMERREQELRDTQVPGAKNFPPFHFFCIKPCFYHDINVEIPEASKRTCKMLFYAWQFYVFSTLFNFVAAIASLAFGGSVVTFIISLLYVVILPPLSFVCWYRPIYKALRSDSSFSYMTFFFVVFVQIIILIFYALGVFLGTVGWVNAAKVVQKDKGTAVGIIMFISATLWTLCALIEILLLRKVHNAYRRSGASFEKAQVEFGKGVASNEHVQSAAKQAVVQQTNTQY